MESYAKGIIDNVVVEKPKLPELSTLLEGKLKIYEELVAEMYDKITKITIWDSPENHIEEESIYDGNTYVSNMHLQLNRFDELNTRLKLVLKGIKSLI